MFFTSICYSSRKKGQDHPALRKNLYPSFLRRSSKCIACQKQTFLDNSKSLNAAK